jgi:NADH-quinone oxidoreductase subunit M
MQELLASVGPALLAFAVGAALPRRRGGFERFVLGLVAALSVLAVRWLWPGSSGEATAAESTTLLTTIVFLPIVGALALLFLPRQSPVLLKRFTLGLLWIDFLISLQLLSVP